ncbi:hypothetical protein LUZ60_006181 [Juncus effusus]|nr:hypothetical protein LUZ60_006181 [Juncus effusus]
MSWLARSIATSLHPPEQEEDPSPPLPMAESTGTTPAQGVRDDLSDLSKTLSRGFKGVASFLAPPPSNNRDPSDGDDVQSSPDSPSVTGFDISKIASSFLQLKSEDEYEEEEEEDAGVSGDEGFDAIGVTDEVLAFARNISMHPETWLDFPLLPDEDEPDCVFSYFDMSEAQIEHAMAIERLAPRLAALRIELCPIHMSQDCFWKIYFVLLHPRLNKHDADLLSTPQIVEARAMLMQSLQSKTKPETEEYKYNNNPTLSDSSTGFPSTDLDAEKDLIQSNEVHVEDKCVIKEEIISDSQNNSLVQKIEVENDSDDEWFNKETELQEGFSSIQFGEDQEDVSFSDLEDDDFYTK